MGLDIAVIVVSSISAYAVLSILEKTSFFG